MKTTPQHKIRHDMTLEEAQDEVMRLQDWVDDLQSGMWVNCVYCGHNYGPREDTPVAMADVLKEHVMKCPLHPMSKMREALEHIRTMARLAAHQAPHVDLRDIMNEIQTSVDAALE
jgi:hypothetical protein